MAAPNQTQHAPQAAPAEPARERSPGGSPGLAFGEVMTPEHVLALQRTSGNAKVTRYLEHARPGTQRFGPTAVPRAARRLRSSPAAAGRLQRLLLDTVASPEERRRIEILPVVIDPSTLATIELYFGSTGPGGGIPSHITAVVEPPPAIPQRWQAPLLSAANVLAVLGGPNAQIPLGTTVTVVLRAGTFRFTSFMRAAAGRRGAPPPNPQWTIVIESVSQPPPPAAAAAGAQGGAGARPRPRSLQTRGRWSRQELAALRAAIALLPDSISVSGLTFVRGARSPGGESGIYRRQARTITIYDEAFGDSHFGPVGQIAETIVHELGHADDSAPLDAADRRHRSSGGGPQADQALMDERSHSGLRYERNTSGDLEDVERPDDVSGDFRLAAERDGAIPGRGTTRERRPSTIRGGVTDYANEHWHEYYAEAYALYFLDPDALRSLRPNVFEYFERRFHRWTPPAAPAAGSAPAGGSAPAPAGLGRAAVLRQSLRFRGSTPVEQAQQDNRALAYDTRTRRLIQSVVGSPTSEWDAQTIDAIMRWQALQGIVASGRIQEGETLARIVGALIDRGARDAAISVVVETDNIDLGVLGTPIYSPDTQGAYSVVGGAGTAHPRLGAVAFTGGYAALLMHVRAAVRAARQAAVPAPEEHERGLVTNDGRLRQRAAVEGGEVRVHTDLDVFHTGGDRRAPRNQGFSVGYSGAQAGESRWLSFLWREVVPTRPGNPDSPRSGETRNRWNRAYALTTDPRNPAYTVDTASGTSPFYDEAGDGARTPDAVTMVDEPGDVLADHILPEFRAGASRVVSRAHFEMFLIRGAAPIQQVGMTLSWTYPDRATAERGFPPPRLFEPRAPQAVTALPDRMRRVLHQQFLNYSYIE